MPKPITEWESERALEEFRHLPAGAMVWRDVDKLYVANVADVEFELQGGSSWGCASMKARLVPKGDAENYLVTLIETPEQWALRVVRRPDEYSPNQVRDALVWLTDNGYKITDA